MMCPILLSLNTVTAFTTASSQTLSGTKEPDTSVILNGNEVVPIDPETTWSYEKPLTEGINPISLYSRNLAGMASEVVVTQIIRDTTAPHILTSVPANGSYVLHPWRAIDLKLKEETRRSMERHHSGKQRCEDPQGVEVSGQWTADANHFVFTPEMPLSLDGLYTVTVHPTDKPIGNTRTETLTFTVDLTAPARLILDEVPSPTNITPLTLSGAKEAGASVWMDGRQVIPADGLTSWSLLLDLAEGENSHRLYAMDLAGHRSEETGVQHHP